MFSQWLPQFPVTQQVFALGGDSPKKGKHLQPDPPSLGSPALSHSAGSVKQTVRDRVPEGGTGDSWIRADLLLLINTVPGFLFGLFLVYALYFNLLLFSSSFSSFSPLPPHYHAFIIHYEFSF